MENIKGQFATNNTTGDSFYISEVTHDGKEWIITLEPKYDAGFKINGYDFDKSYTAYKPREQARD